MECFKVNQAIILGKKEDTFSQVFVNSPRQTNLNSTSLFVVVNATAAYTVPTIETSMFTLTDLPQTNSIKFIVSTNLTLKRTLTSDQSHKK